ncbi:MAG TPA: hypothetical protein ENK11_07200 [Phycisphaerales bacterium]|nr:hypothetical protein [Phycisphaerales bacterium]
MRVSRFHFVVVLVLCWAQVAAAFAAAGYVRTCLDATGKSHVEISGSSICTGVRLDYSGEQIGRDGKTLFCKCGPCTHELVPEAQAVVRTPTQRIDRDVPDVRPMLIRDSIVSVAACPRVRMSVSTVLSHESPPGSVASLRTIILIV